MLRPGMHIHIVGVGGYGMSPIAHVLLLQGYTVSGSDLRANDLTRALQQAGATVYQGHDAAHITGADLVVATSAATDDNPEIAAARAQGIPVLWRRDLLGELMARHTGIAIAGTHGKTTTTALMTHVLIEAGRDPTYIVGGVMRRTGANAGVGQGPEFVIEADEYGYMFLGLRPKIAVVTNIEHDHPDIFPTEADVLDAFRQFVARLPDDGLLVACADDPNARQFAEARRAADQPVLTYGIDAPQADWIASDLEPDAAGGMRFTVRRRGQMVGQVRLNLAGRHNVLNALAVIAVADQLGVPFEQVAAACASFAGTERRSQVMGAAGGVTVVNDYGHHPTAIRVTVEAYRSRPGEGALWAVWQPHTFGRMRTLADAFESAFAGADHVLVTDVYSVRETVGPGLDAAGMAEQIRAAGHPDAQYTGAPDATAQTLLDSVRPGDVVLILSAGDAPAIGEMVLKQLRAREEQRG
ncbi:MAG: UDP-N-acetylmuramate--L-alanine ligase [Chloroflexi bacterium]|nr:UDP-N-acetylmuramate--L-alanine ligase [Chloroflexota bacterium]